MKYLAVGTTKKKYLCIEARKKTTCRTHRCNTNYVRSQEQFFTVKDHEAADKKFNQKEEILLPSDPELCCGMFCYSERVTESAEYHGNCRRTTGAAVKSQDSSFREDPLWVSPGKDTGQSGPWLEPVWQVFHS